MRVRCPNNELGGVASFIDIASTLERLFHGSSRFSVGVDLLGLNQVSCIYFSPDRSVHQFEPMHLSMLHKGHPPAFRPWSNGFIGQTFSLAVFFDQHM
jgi:hypothetical protein